MGSNFLIMGHLASNSLSVRVLWADHHSWPPGQEYKNLCTGYALWFMLAGAADVWGDDQCWHVSAGHIFCWPKNKPRYVITSKGASWLSLGFDVITVGQNDIFKSLSLPATHKVTANDGDFLQSWLQQIIELRSSPKPLSHRRHTGTDALASTFAASDSWVSQMVAERSSHLDLIEDGLARAIVAWCWNLWATTDLKRALHHQSPAWLQVALDCIRDTPTISVHDLARAAGFSPAQFRRSFHQQTGLSPRDYLQRERLETARRLLETTDLPIATVATQTGFTTSHFVQLWKQKTGLPPLQYRLSQKEAKF